MESIAKRPHRAADSLQAGFVFDLEDGFDFHGDVGLLFRELSAHFSADVDALARQIQEVSRADGMIVGSSNRRNGWQRCFDFNQRF